MRHSSILALLALTACNNPGSETDTDDGDDNGDDNGDDTGDDNGDGTPVETIDYRFGFFEFLSGEAVAGATVTTGDDTHTTDDDGFVDLTVVSESYVQISAASEGYPDAHFSRYVGPSDWYTERYYPATSTLELLSGALGLEIGTSKGQVLAITPLGCDPAGGWSDCFFLEGVTVDLDVGYEIALVEDSSQAMGMGVGNETKGGAVMFVNVDAGAVVPTMTAPSGYSCDYISPSIEVAAMGYHEVSVYCPPE